MAGKWTFSGENDFLWKESDNLKVIFSPKIPL